MGYIGVIDGGNITNLQSQINTLNTNKADSSAVVGIGQTWQSFTVGTQRINNTDYTNSTGKPITVTVSAQSNGTQFDAFMTFYVNGTAVATNGASGGATSLGSTFSSITVVVPNGATYKASQGTYGTINKWFELR